MERKYILASVVIFIVLIGILVVSKISTGVDVKLVKLKDFKSTSVENSYTLIYLGNVDENRVKEMKKYNKDYLITPYYNDDNLEDVSQFVSQYTDSFSEEQLELEDLNKYLIFLKDKLVAVVDGDLNDEQMREQLDKYLHNIIPQSERYYRVLSTADEFKKKVNSKEYTITVFGAESCSYCNLYLPVFNKIAKKYNLDIFYFDADNYDKNEYNKVLETELAIPAECTLDDKDTTIKGAFPKPMTIISKSGKEVGCIRGYVTEDVVVEKLKEFGIIKKTK